MSGGRLESSLIKQEDPSTIKPEPNFLGGQVIRYNYLLGYKHFCIRMFTPLMEHSRLLVVYVVYTITACSFQLHISHIYPDRINAQSILPPLVNAS